MGLFPAAVEFLEGAVGVLLFGGGDFGRGDVDLHDWGIVEIVLGDGRPLGKAFAVGVAGLGEVGPVVAHLAGQIEVVSVKGSPALHQCLELEPEV